MGRVRKTIYADFRVIPKGMWLNCIRFWVKNILMRITTHVLLVCEFTSGDRDIVEILSL